MNNKPSLIDIGANLSHESFKDDLPQVIDDAKTQGLVNILLTGTCIDSSQLAIDLSQQHPGFLYSTAGIHPHDASTFNDQSLAQLSALAKNASVKAIGETGLDFNRDFSPRDIQEKAFDAQLGLASDLQLPVFLHQRDAHQRFLPILQEYRPSLSNGVVHCFTGNREELYAYLDLDMYIGITGWVCDERRGQHLLELLSDIPPERLLIETDSPYLTPRSIRPKPKTRRNVPANLTYVLKTIAEKLDKAEAELAAQTTNNAKKFFSI